MLQTSSFKYLPALLSVLLLASCANSPTENISDITPHHTQYCDSYLSYQMCVQDVDSDGQADLLYFQDTNEIFMLSPEYAGTEFPNLGLHRCIQTMDPEIRQASSQLLGIDDRTGGLRKAQLKSRLILDYSRYLPAISRCMNGNSVANSTHDQVEFGDEDFDEL